MLAAGGGEVRERERQKETEIVTNQRDCARSARDGGRVEAGREPFPGGARRWEVARTKRNTRETRERHSLPLPTGRHTRWGTPWARHSPPSQRSPVWRLSHGQHKPSHHQETAPTQGRNGSIGQALRKERYPRTLGEKTTQSWLVSSQSATDQRPPEQRCREGWKHPFPGMLQRSPPSLGREMAQD